MSTEQAQTALHTDEAVALAHGLASTVAATHKVRILFVKGLTVQALGLRPPRPVADVDILVEPSARESYLSALDGLGWHERPRLTLPPKAGNNATTLVHDRWPTDLDVHTWMRGVYSSPQIAFELLWQQRITVTIAGVDVPTPSRSGSALLAAVNCLRDPFLAHKLVELDAIAAAVRANFTSEEVCATVALARSLRCVTTARPFLVAISPESASALRNDLNAQERAEWARLTVRASSTLAWWTSVRSAPWPKRVSRTLRFIWPDDYTLHRTRPRTRSGLLWGILGRLQRIGSGAAKTPRAITAWRQRKRELLEQAGSPRADNE